MLEPTEVRSTEFLEKIGYEKVLGLLWNRNAERFEVRGMGALSHIVREPEVPRETKVKTLDRKPVKPSVVQALHPERLNGFHLVSLQPQGFDKFPRQVLVEQDLHAGCRSFLRASSASVPRTDSSLRLG